VVAGLDEEPVYVDDPSLEAALLNVTRRDFSSVWMAFGHYHATISPE
jgi:hypothetical protein